MAAVSVIVPARDALATLPALLDALAAQDPVPGGFEVVVADDGSSDGTGDVARAHPAVTRVVGTGGVGPGAARNAGIAVATGAVLAFTDADCIPDRGWLVAGVRALDAGADLVQGAVVPAGPLGPFDRTVRVGQFTGLFETANLFARADRVAQAGGFEPWLDPRRSKELGEDVWLGWRLQRAGARVAFAADAQVAHAVFPGTPASFVAEHARLRFFPMMVARIPELRATFAYRRRFLNRRTAAFDLAAAGMVMGALTGRRAPLLAAVPYGRHVWRFARPWGRRRGPVVAAARVAADSIGCVALVAGSARSGKPLL
ncbi:MAG: glycosyl transferase family 2 [Frankiales bacterium]|nr:glycosyl transferase family 2 [Frankiales bacterium]MCW3017159.1 glycosyl transferase family 2 [Solirubrobacterales bacterium]